jgi:hypothetical protein
MGEWRPDDKVSIDDYSGNDYDEMYEDTWNGWTTALLWIVPAKVDGTWKLEKGEISIRQEFQMISGKYKSGNNTVEIKDGKLNGNTITFSIDGKKYTGHVNGDKTMEGTSTYGTAKQVWVATYSGI